MISSRKESAARNRCVGKDSPKDLQGHHDIPERPLQNRGGDTFQFTVPAPFAPRRMHYKTEASFPLPRSMVKSRKRRAFESDGPNSDEISPRTEMLGQDKTLKPTNSMSMARFTPPSSPNVGFSTPANRRFALSPTTQELSSFGNMTIQSLGSSFASYSNGKAPFPPDSNTSVTSASLVTPRSQIKQSPRHVPIAVVSTDATEALAIPSTPRETPQTEGSLLLFGSPSAIQSPVIHESPNFLLPRCSKISSNSRNHSRISNASNHNKNTPPISFLRLDHSEKKGDHPRKSSLGARPTTSRSLLKKSTSTDSLDDFHSIDDACADGSLSDSCDEGGWFFLCSPKKNTATDDDSPRSQKKQKAPNLKASMPPSIDPSSLKKFEFTSDAYANNQGFPKINTQLPARLRKPRNPGASANSLFGMDIICEHSMSRQSSTDFELLAKRSSTDLLSTRDNTLLPRAIVRTESDQSIGLCLDSAQLYGGSRDMITPPVLSSSQPEQPPLMKRRLQEQKIVIEYCQPSRVEKVKK